MSVDYKQPVDCTGYNEEKRIMTEETKSKVEEAETVKEAAEEKAKTFSEQLEVAGKELVEQVQDLVKQGNVRKLIIKTADDRELIQVSLTVGAVAGGVAALAAPWLAALGAIAALVARVKIEIVREENI